MSQLYLFIFFLSTILKTNIFHCFKNYGSPTRATKSKDAPNMADPISLTVALRVRAFSIRLFGFTMFTATVYYVTFVE